MRSRLRTLACSALLALASACGGGTPIPPEEVVRVPAQGTVVVFVEAPRYIAGPILKMFSEQTGITVEATYREEVGAGFAENLQAAVAGKKADVLWGASPLLALELQAKELLVPFRPAGAGAGPLQYHDRAYRWIGFAVNPRVILAHDSDAARARPPATLEDLVEGPWAGKGVLTRPAEGPPAFHAAVLFAL